MVLVTFMLDSLENVKFCTNSDFFKLVDKVKIILVIFLVGECLK